MPRVAAENQETMVARGKAMKPLTLRSILRIPGSLPTA